MLQKNPPEEVLELVGPLLKVLSGLMWLHILAFEVGIEDH